MPRARGIKPGFFQDADLVELDFATRLFFIGLWTLADRDGRLEDNPKKIKSEILPYDEVDVVDLINQLESVRLINRVVFNNTNYIEILNPYSWYQKPKPLHEIAITAANRRALLKKARPKWADSKKISRFYKKACELNELTNKKWHVDHIIPLSGNNVCGLHVHTNLQVIPAEKNIKKSNKFIDIEGLK